MAKWKVDGSSIAVQSLLKSQIPNWNPIILHCLEMDTDIRLKVQDGAFIQIIEKTENNNLQFTEGSVNQSMMKTARYCKLKKYLIKLTQIWKDDAKQ